MVAVHARIKYHAHYLARQQDWLGHAGHLNRHRTDMVHGKSADFPRSLLAIDLLTCMSEEKFPVTYPTIISGCAPLFQKAERSKEKKRRTTGNENHVRKFTSFHDATPETRFGKCTLSHFDGFIASRPTPYLTAT